MNINISEEDFGTLCICALRYCHGRKTYMPKLVQQIVGEHLSAFSTADLHVLAEDCRRQHADSSLYGDPVDKEDWLQWGKAVLEELEQRKNLG